LKKGYDQASPKLSWLIQFLNSLINSGQKTQLWIQRREGGSRQEREQEPVSALLNAACGKSKCICPHE
jgi:hypothetical protein